MLAGYSMAGYSMAGYGLTCSFSFVKLMQNCSNLVVVRNENILGKFRCARWPGRVGRLVSILAHNTRSRFRAHRDTRRLC